MRLGFDPCQIHLVPARDLIEMKNAKCVERCGKPWSDAFDLLQVVGRVVTGQHQAGRPADSGNFTQIGRGLTPRQGDDRRNRARRCRKRCIPNRHGRLSRFGRQADLDRMGRRQIRCGSQRQQWRSGRRQQETIAKAVMRCNRRGWSDTPPAGALNEQPNAGAEAAPDEIDDRQQQCRLDEVRHAGHPPRPFCSRRDGGEALTQPVTQPTASTTSTNGQSNRSRKISVSRDMPSEALLTSAPRRES